MAIEWIAVADQFPPIGEWILTAFAGNDWPRMETNALRYGNDELGKSSELCYWDSGDDFDKVTHWAILPEMPGEY